jgi:integrase
MPLELAKALIEQGRYGAPRQYLKLVLKELTLDRAEVEDLLGHSSVTTTQRYTHMSADDLREQVAGMPGNGSS